jgi:hypothetical protein
MAVIYTIRLKNGTVRYRAQAERKDTGKVYYNCRSTKEAEDWIHQFFLDHPAANNKYSISYNDLPRFFARPPRNKLQTIQVAGCTLVEDYGRCPPMDRCRYYFKCLSHADAADWVGWRIL